MTVAYVEEYRSAGYLPGGGVVQAPKGPPLRVQTVSFTGTPGITALALRPDTGLIVISATGNAAWLLTTNPEADATTSDAPLWAGTYRALHVEGAADKYVSFIDL